MAKYYFTNKAVEDLTHIWEYTYEVWSENQADKYYEYLLKSCYELAKNPNLGKNYHEIIPNLMGYLASRHIIFYQVISKNEIEIIRILHGRMELKSRITE